MKKKVYIAGPINASNVVDALNNIQRGIDASVEALLSGVIPFSPFLDFQLVLASRGKIDIPMIREYSMEWLYACEEIWVLPNWETSTGTKAEIAVAKELGLPIIYLPA